MNYRIPMMRARLSARTLALAKKIEIEANEKLLSSIEEDIEYSTHPVG